MVSRKGLYRGMKSVQVIPRTLETFISDLIIILKNIYLTVLGRVLITACKLLSCGILGVVPTRDQT